MNGVWLDFVALIICFIVIAIFIYKKQIKTQETIIYKYLIIFSLFFFLNKFLGHMLLCGNIKNEIVNIIEKCHLISFLIISFLFTWYSFTISNMKEKTKNNFFNMFLIFLIIISILIFIIPFNVTTHFRINGIPYFLALLGDAFYFISIIIFVMQYFINEKKFDEKAIVLLVILLLFGSFLFFKIIHLNIISESYVISFTLLVMLFTLEDNVEIDNKAIFMDDVKKLLTNILQSGKEITKTDSLDLAKNEANRVVDYSSKALEFRGSKEIVDEDDKKENYDIEKFFREIIDFYKQKMQEKELEFSYNITPDLPKEVFGNRNNLYKIIINLLNNAYKYTDEGFVHLEISCVNTYDNCKLIIVIEDSGCGIKGDDVNKLFENNKSLGETKQLVESLNGRIIVHTIFDEGSKFTVVVNQKIVGEKKNIIMSENFTDANYKGLRIIVVDDDAYNLKIIKKLLERFMIEDVIYLDNGYDLIEKMKDNYKCDAILLDIKMSKIDGLDTFNKLKEIKNFSVPVVALLANEMPDKKQKYIEKGFFNYLTKPIQKNELTKILDNIKNKSCTKDCNMIVDDSEQEVIEPPLIDAIDYLKKKGVEIDKSLEFLGDLDMYNDTLKDFLTEVEEKWMNIEKYKLEGNMKEYAILIHSLKSDCKYLGFMRLADISYQHELSSKANDSDFVNKNFKSLEEEFNKVLNIAKDYEERYLN